MPPEKKEEVKMKHVKAPEKFEKTLPPEKKEKVRVQNVKAQANHRLQRKKESTLNFATCSIKSAAVYTYASRTKTGGKNAARSGRIQKDYAAEEK